MEEKERIDKQNEDLAFQYCEIKKEVFNKVIEVIREDLVATYLKESDTSLRIKLVGGLQFRLTIEEA